MKEYITCKECGKKVVKKTTGRQYYCSKDCQIKGRKEAQREYHRKYRRKQNLKDKYGITMNDFQRLLDKQHNKCAICGCEETYIRNGRVRELCIDHDHKTGEVRGLLCSHCNKGLGEFFDNSLSLIKATRYLSR